MGALDADAIRQSLDEELAGPEPLPVRFYRESAATFLRGSGGGA